MQWQNRIVKQNGCAPMRTNVHEHLLHLSKDYVTLLSLNLLLCLHLLNISERLLMLVRRSAFKIANFSSKHRLQDLARALKLAEACFVICHVIFGDSPRSFSFQTALDSSIAWRFLECLNQSLQSKPLPT